MLLGGQGLALVFEHSQRASYVGPGAGVDSIAISPRIPFIFFGDSLRFQVLAFQAGVPVPQFYVSWTTALSGFALSLAIGLVSGIIPAARAASLSVVNGLRKVV